MSWNTLTDFHISLTASDADQARITAFLAENLDNKKWTVCAVCCNRPFLCSYMVPYFSRPCPSNCMIFNSSTAFQYQQCILASTNNTACLA